MLKHTTNEENALKLLFFPTFKKIRVREPILKSGLTESRRETIFPSRQIQRSAAAHRQLKVLFPSSLAAHVLEKEITRVTFN